MLSFHVKFVQTDRRATVKQYAPRSFDMGVIKKKKKKKKKKTEDPVQLEPRTTGLRVKHFTTEPHRTSLEPLKVGLV